MKVILEMCCAHETRYPRFDVFNQITLLLLWTIITLSRHNKTVLEHLHRWRQLAGNYNNISNAQISELDRSRA